MGHPQNIILVGFMGTGKTTVGRRLADALGMTFVDMDDVIVERAGKPIPRIFEEDGEPHFRNMERQLVRDLAAQPGLVVGAGGGIVLDPGNVADFSATGLVICLWAEPQAVLDRVAGDTNRPLLQVEDKLARICELLEKRRPLYEAIPCRIDTTGLTAEQVVEQALDRFRGGTHS